jgi:DNA-binding CsgD family transcriptional regulator
VTPAGTEVRHGWTLAALTDLAATVVARHRHWWPAGDIADQHAAAWEGITEELLTADISPSRTELAGAGLRSLSRHVSGDRRHQGDGSHNPIANAGAKFAAYWDWHGAPAADPANGITERLAVAQILPALTPRQREALTLLAAYEDYQDAAAAMGVAVGTFETHITRARAAFRALWHEGETPSRPWRKDKRVYSRTPREAAVAECGTVRAYWQHHRRKEHVDQACRDAHNTYNREHAA